MYHTLYGYDAASRLSTASDGTNSAAYTYVANSPLVSQIEFTNAGALRMTTSKNWDYLNRLTSISSANASGVVLDSHGYLYNSANQRTSHTNADGSYWLYGYDFLGQVTSGKKFWPDGTPVAGQQFGYAFDNIGNRTATQAGGDQFGANLLSASYSANNLNQYTSRTVPGAVDILGSATNLATVTVNNYPTIRKESYYRAEIPIANGSGPVYQSITNLAVLNRGTSADLIATNIGNVLVPPAAQAFTYDQDGNTTNDSLWSYVWDGENRLVQMTSDSTVPAAAQKQLNFGYDDQGRRMQKIVAGQSTNIFLYDGWNLVCELDGASGTVIRNYIWGSDLTGSMQGAGGVGGLLSISLSGTNSFVAYDGNGNVSALINALDGSQAAHYEYSPFGGVLRTSGVLAEANPLEFSTKYHDSETDLIYYGLRFCSQIVGKWLNRDPLLELDSRSLYTFVQNDPISAFDPDGQITVALVHNGMSPIKRTCGTYSLMWDFTLTSAAWGDGYIIQEIHLYDWFETSGGSASRSEQHYWEAFVPLVPRGQIATRRDHALSITPSSGTIGYEESLGTIKFFPKSLTGDLEKNWSTTAVPPANGLPATKTEPWWWKGQTPSEPAGMRIAIADWDCCCKAANQYYSLFYRPN